MECSQDGGILPVNQILLNSCSMTSRDFMDICLNISLQMLSGPGVVFLVSLIAERSLLMEKA